MVNFAEGRQSAAAYGTEEFFGKESSREGEHGFGPAIDKIAGWLSGRRMDWPYDSGMLEEKKDRLKAALHDFVVNLVSARDLGKLFLLDRRGGILTHDELEQLKNALWDKARVDQSLNEGNFAEAEKRLEVAKEEIFVLIETSAKRDSQTGTAEV